LLVGPHLARYIADRTKVAIVPGEE
jgi:hypothetical protein